MQDLCHQAIHAGLLAFERISIRQESVFFFFFNFLAGLGLCGCAGFSLVETRRGALQSRSAGFSSQRLLLLQSMGSVVQGLQQLRLPGPRAQAL